VTEDVAARFAAVSDGMRGRGIDPHRAGHFLMKLMFCMFAEDIDLLPEDLFLRTVKNCKGEPAKLSKLLANLFDAMAHKGGTFGADEIPWVNGGLFQDAEVIDLYDGGAFGGGGFKRRSARFTNSGKGTCSSSALLRERS
jgi:hypothetical protein